MGEKPPYFSREDNQIENIFDFRKSTKKYHHEGMYAQKKCGMGMEKQLTRNLPSEYIEIENPIEWQEFTKKYRHEVLDAQKNFEMAMEKQVTRNKRNMNFISDELKSIKTAEIIEEKKRQRLRRDCEELRLLSNQLQKAIISKELCDQYKQIEIQRKIGERAKFEGQVRAQEEHLKTLEVENEKEKKRLQKQRELLEAHKIQMEETKKQRLDKLQNLIEERNERDFLQRRIEEEDKQMEIEKQKQSIRLRNEMLEDRQSKIESKKLEKLKTNVVNAKVLEYQQKIYDDRQLLEAQKRAIMKQQQDQRELAGYNLLQKEEKRRQREDLLRDLMVQEHQAKEDKAFREQLQHETEERRRAKQELALYRKNLLARQEESIKKRREKAILTRTKLETREDEKQRLLEQKELHNKRKEHGNELLAMIKENERKRAENIAESMQFLMIQEKEDKARQKIIEEERIKMLRDLPTDVLRYLPNGVLRDSDYQHLPL